MIEIIATANSVDHANKLIQIGVDTLYIGEEKYGLRLPVSFTLEEIKLITEMVHERGKKVYISVNAIMHNEKIETITPYLEFLERIQVDAITVGDPGVIHLLKKLEINLPFIYDAQTLVTSSKQINFWSKRGARGAVLARELTYKELQTISQQAIVPTEVLVYGPTCIHHSKRPLVENYSKFVNQDIDSSKQESLYVSEVKKPDTQYSIYEDQHGTHIFARKDINLLPHLDKLYNSKLLKWKLDGLFTEEEEFLLITEQFVQAKDALLNNKWSEQLAKQLNDQLMKYQPSVRGLDSGFFLKDPSEIQ